MIKDAAFAVDAVAARGNVSLLRPDAALFLDFDGTLVPIVARPELVEVGPWLVPALVRLQAGLSGAIALVSGRPLSQLDAFLAPLTLPAAGVHGAERRDPTGQVHRSADAPPIDAVQAAEQLVREHPALQLERKPAAFALHYRAAPQLGTLCETRLTQAVAPHAQWMALHGKCVVEIKPRHATKGHAVREFLAAPEFAGRLPVFVGDDATDEEGFEAVQSVGGLGIKVGDGPTAAHARLDDPLAVQRWLLASLAEWPADGPGARARFPA